MKKTTKVILSIVCILVLAILYYLISPLWRVVTVSEAMPEVMSTTGEKVASIEMASGNFTGFDKLHTGSGTVKIIKTGDKTFVRFEEDFKTTNGPDLYVGFGKNSVYSKGSEIARLKGTMGGQNYELEGEFDFNAYNEVWVWCKLFGVPFVKASLEITLKHEAGSQAFSLGGKWNFDEVGPLMLNGVVKPVWDYNLTIDPKNENIGRLTIDGLQTMTDLNVSIQKLNDSANIIMQSNNIDGGQQYKRGEVLFVIAPNSEGELMIDWLKIQPNVPENKEGAVFKKIK